MEGELHEPWRDGLGTNRSVDFIRDCIHSGGVRFPIRWSSSRLLRQRLTRSTNTLASQRAHITDTSRLEFLSWEVTSLVSAVQ